MIVVLDTNIWVSGLHFARQSSTPTRAIEKAISEDTIATCSDMEDEVHRILTTKFCWELNRARDALAAVLARSIRVHLKGGVKACRDPKDDMFLECALLASADLLIAGDKDLLVLGKYKGTHILTPAEYVNLPASKLL